MNNNNSNTVYSHLTNLSIGPELSGQRLDKAIAQLLPQYSRANITKWIRAGYFSPSDSIAVLKPKNTVYEGDVIVYNQDNLKFIDTTFALHSPPEASSDVDYKIVFEDEHLLVINKPNNLVVHPAPGNLDKTLVNGLLAHCPELIDLPRHGIIHRLDKDTTGLLIIAKSLVAHQKLVQMMHNREVKRIYWALVHGKVIYPGTIDLPMARHPRDRKRMAVVEHGGRSAITHYYPIQQFERKFTLLKIKLETGRTHQIRVHLQHSNFPVVGDQTYAGRYCNPFNFTRQALHARELCFNHPVTNQELNFHAELPQDFQNLLSELGKK